MAEPIDHTLRGFLARTETGVSATLESPGYRHTLTGVPAEVGGVKGYAVEVRLTGVSEKFWVMGDAEYFEMLKLTRNGA